MFTQSIKFYTSHYHVLKSTDIWKMWFIKLIVKMNGSSFQQVLQQNLSWFLSWHWKTLFLRGFILKPSERTEVILKTLLGIFKIALRLQDRHVFTWQSVKILNVFSTLNLKQIFWKTKTFFKKLEYRFLVERTKIKNASFSYKNAISEANAKTNSMVSTKWIYHKERSFASSYFIFLKILFQFKNLL